MTKLDSYPNEQEARDQMQRGEIAMISEEDNERVILKPADSDNYRIFRARGMTAERTEANPINEIPANVETFCISFADDPGPTEINLPLAIHTPFDLTVINTTEEEITLNGSYPEAIRTIDGGTTTFTLPINGVVTFEAFGGYWYVSATNAGFPAPAP